MKEVTIYTDGACRGNPGPGGYGVVLQYARDDGQVFRKEMKAGYRLTTNNRMEILAAVVSLEALKVPCRITLYSDSQYLVNAMTKGWLEKWQRQGWYKDAKKKEKAKNIYGWIFQECRTSLSYRMNPVMSDRRSIRYLKNRAKN